MARGEDMESCANYVFADRQRKESDACDRKIVGVKCLQTDRERNNVMRVIERLCEVFTDKLIQVTKRNK